MTAKLEKAVTLCGSRPAGEESTAISSVPVWALARPALKRSSRAKRFMNLPPGEAGFLRFPSPLGRRKPEFCFEATISPARCESDRAGLAHYQFVQARGNVIGQGTNRIVTVLRVEPSG